MTPDNPHWVGAWWIGFLAGGAAALLVAFPILGYPRQLPGIKPSTGQREPHSVYIPALQHFLSLCSPGSQEHVAMRVSEAHQLKDGSHVTAADPLFGKTVKDMPR